MVMCFEGNLITKRSILDCHNTNIIVTVLVVAFLVVAVRVIRNKL